MIYQVNATLFFREEDEAKDFYHDCEKALPKAMTVNPDGENSEASIIELIDNHHDESPNASCFVREVKTSET